MDVYVQQGKPNQAENLFSFFFQKNYVWNTNAEYSFKTDMRQHPEILSNIFTMFKSFQIMTKNEFLKIKISYMN